MLLSIEQQLQELNNEVKCTIAPSKIHGIGVFALRDIKKGEELNCFLGKSSGWYTIPYERLNELRPEIKQIILARWPLIINGSAFKSPNDDVTLACFMNHSDNPNCDLKYKALRDIEKGEELLENYKLFDGNFKRVKEIFPFIN